MTQQPSYNTHSPLLLVISGPSGVGKDLLLSHIKESGVRCFFTVTATTRPMRSGERDGIDYYFVSKQQFEAMIANDDLLEWATVYGNYYGIPKQQVVDALNRGLDVFLKIDVQGAATIRKIVPEAVCIFLAPPSEAELEHRLRMRGTEDQSALESRLRQAKQEMREGGNFDYTVIHYTNRTAEAVIEIEEIIRLERERNPSRKTLIPLI